MLGTLRRTTPISDQWGFDRGNAVDRHYIETFLQRHNSDIHGRTLEVQGAHYTKLFGEGVTHFDVLDIDASNESATLIADLARAVPLPRELYDCFVLTQTLHLIYDLQAAVHNARSLLRPGGVLLATVPSVSRIVPESNSDYWRFTGDSCSRLFGDIFGAQNVTVTCFGNVLACVAFLHGLAAEELTQSELDVCDPGFPLVIGVRAVKT